jgi:uncharacterized membrane protein YvlD (DUF360 family)
MCLFSIDEFIPSRDISEKVSPVIKIITVWTMDLTLVAAAMFLFILFRTIDDEVFKNFIFSFTIWIVLSGLFSMVISPIILSLKYGMDNGFIQLTSMLPEFMLRTSFWAEFIMPLLYILFNLWIAALIMRIISSPIICSTKRIVFLFFCFYGNYSNFSD